jgi:hypothetical protein
MALQESDQPIRCLLPQAAKIVPNAQPAIPKEFPDFAGSCHTFCCGCIADCCRELTHRACPCLITTQAERGRSSSGAAIIISRRELREEYELQSRQESMAVRLARQRRLVAAVALHHFVGERKSLGLPGPNLRVLESFCRVRAPSRGLGVKNSLSLRDGSWDPSPPGRLQPAYPK